MADVNIKKIDPTVRIFDQFYDLDLVVNADQYQVVYSFFQNYTDNNKVAASYTDTLFRISNETQVNVLDLLQTFQGNEQLKISLTMAYYLNTLSNKTIMYGVNNTISSNQSSQRNVVQ